MKKNFLVMGLLTLGLGLATTGCSDDDNSGMTEDEAQNLEYTTELAPAWGNYAVNVAKLLANDSQTLYDEWNDDFAYKFKTHNNSGYSSAKDCVEEILQGCIDIANEVGTAKIGEPYDYWISGKKNRALYAVESWYSWHSRDDYKNNILSIINALCGERCEVKFKNDKDEIAFNPNNINYHSLTSPSIMYCFMEKGVATQNWALLSQAGTVYTKAIAAWNAIDNIPAPFRNNIGSAETVVAMDSCATLVKELSELKGMVDALGDDWDDTFQAIVDQFVDGVVLPTYAALVVKNNELLAAVQNLNAVPSNKAFEEACQAWLAARQPWETSEAFLFGPVAELGLDPNMDSWPLDAVGIANLLKSQKWANMEWSGEYEEDNEAIEAAQALRGFHTLEFLLFKNGEARKIK